MTTIELTGWRINRDEDGESYAFRVPAAIEAVQGARFRISPVLVTGYGIDPDQYELGSVEGLLQFACEYVNYDLTKERAMLRFRSLFQSRPDASGWPAVGPVWTPSHGAQREWQDQLLRLLGAAAERKASYLSTLSDESLLEIGKQMEAGVVWKRLLFRSGRATLRGRGLEQQTDGVVLAHEATVISHDGLCALLRILLMNRKHRSQLRRCPNPSCRIDVADPVPTDSPSKAGKFFVKEGKQVYCSKECATDANDHDAARRQQARRKRLAVEQALRGFVASHDRTAAAARSVCKAHPDATHEQLIEHAKLLLRPTRKHK